MAKKLKINEYYLDVNGKLKKYDGLESFDQTTTNEINSHPTTDLTEQENIEKAIAKYNEMAHTNPFLYNYDLSSNMSLKSIEDFYVKKGRKEILFEKLVRTNVFRRSKRQKILKKNFKIWENDVKKKLLDLQNYGAVQYNNNSDYLIKKVGFSSYLFNFIGFLLAICLLNESIAMIGAFEGLLYNLIQYSVMIFIFVFLCASLINKFINNSNGVFHRNKLHYDKEQEKIFLDFKKKMKKTYDYYLKKMPRSAYNFEKPQLLIDQTSIRMDNIQKVEDIVSDGTKQLVVRSKNIPSVKFSKAVITFLLVVASLYVYGLAIYRIALFYIEKLSK